MMAIHVVTIVSGTETPVGEGINAPVRCIVRFPDHSIRPAIVKTLPATGVAAEMFCAVLLRGWGLSVPEPALVSTPFAYASMDTGYPNMKQRIGWSESLPPVAKAAFERRAAELVSHFAETPHALAADEAIDNRDRNLGNILWDGQNVAWVDHERALGLIPMVDVNKLAIMAKMSTNMSNVQSAAVTFALGLTPQSVREAEQESSAHVDAAAFAANVSGRLQRLADAVLKRFPQPPGLFSGAP